MHSVPAPVLPGLTQTPLVGRVLSGPRDLQFRSKFTFECIRSRQPDLVGDFVLTVDWAKALSAWVGR
eukprot:2749412-Pyramimonas_sp.AAC.1